MHFVKNLLAVDLGKNPIRKSVLKKKKKKSEKPKKDHILRVPVEGVVLIANLEGATTEL